LPDPHGGPAIDVAAPLPEDFRLQAARLSSGRPA